ncbi:hypothetical protein [Leptolyngbya ohadii]|nr:hypothetical protein [Leptolyngbya ohadii]
MNNQSNGSLGMLRSQRVERGKSCGTFALRFAPGFAQVGNA